ncbi:MAG: UDP-N-acetylmuramoyl-tripeptide--D-alanyl-D-alanine ligase, partial [Pseudomonadota bacterium]|nr:UDP-N-acetylmuramoyl-tripeptide--D-alanyl-D-alanine ligase [Pseudomonadota bacterium]
LEATDARLAFGTLAQGWRRRFTMPLVAVTGSNGKTTVTQMIASVFRAWVGDRALATAGSFNNDVGVPLTLLRMGAGGAPPPLAAVLEIGMNHPGEIAHLAALVAPTIALVNNAQREHLEFMGSVEAVARENGAVIEALPSDGIAVFPVDDAHAATWRALAGERRVVTFGDAPSAAAVTGHAEWRADAWQIAMHTPSGEIEVSLQLPGRHNVHNALAAAACAFAAGCPLPAIATGLSAFTAVKGRSQRHRLVRRGVVATLVDDTYNANPDSMRAAIDILASLPGPRWLLISDMGEVGDQGPEFHREVGAYAQQRGIETLWAGGTLSAETVRAFAGARGHADVPSLVAAIEAAAAQDGLPPFASVLVKGSRFVRMERAVAALLALADPERSDAA